MFVCSDVRRPGSKRERSDFGKKPITPELLSHNQQPEVLTRPRLLPLPIE